MRASKDITGYNALYLKILWINLLISELHENDILQDYAKYKWIGGVPMKFVTRNVPNKRCNTVRPMCENNK